jgi:hypothetical protein
MVGTGIKVLIIDAVLLVAGLLTQQDVLWRSAYASSVLGYSPSVSYSVLTKFFLMAGRGTSLNSPPTIDWVQIVAVVLLIVNFSYVYSVIRGRKLGRSGVPAGPDRL